MKDGFDFAHCAECGSVHYWDDVQKVSDPTATDGTLPMCPDCLAIDELNSLRIHTEKDIAEFWFANFENRDQQRMSPRKVGQSKKDAHDALLASYGLLI